MEVVFLGTNGWYSTSSGNTLCTLVDSRKSYVILDAGDGFSKLDNYVKAEKPLYLFLSHLHLDHIIGLHTLAKFKFKQKLGIYGYKGTREGLTIIRHPYSAPLDDLFFKVEVHDLREGKHNSPFRFTCKSLIHADPCLGYRLELEGKIISYCVDTGVCENLYDLSEGADLLIAECSLKSEQEDWGWPHLKPEDAANVAKQAKAKRLILTHFDASIYRRLEERKEAEANAKKIFRETIAAFDGLKIKI